MTPGRRADAGLGHPEPAGPAGPEPEALAADNRRLALRLGREREIRRQVELIAERGLRDLYEKSRQLEFLRRVATVANQSGSVPALLAAALAEIRRFTGWDAAHAYLLSIRDGRTRLQPTGIWDAEPQLACEPMRRATGTRCFANGEGLPGAVWARAEPVWIEDLRLADGFLRKNEAEACGLRAAFAIPLLIGAEVAAVLEFFRAEASPMDSGLLRVLGQAGTQLGRVIERDRARDRLLHDAMHDSLTALPNRPHFLKHLEQALRDYGRDRRAAFCVLFIDLDKFKVVNDSLGHLAGDALLVEVGRRLQASVRGGDMVARPGIEGGPEGGMGGEAPVLARLGGDEFTILLRGVSSIAAGHAIADRLQDALRQPFHLDGREMAASASVGIAISSPEHRSAHEVLRDADLAMYRAKENGKARYEVYDRAMHEAAVRRMAVESEMRAALRDGGFVLHYQPIISLNETEAGSGPGIAGFEALVRWRTADGRLRHPGDFIGIAEETGLIVPLGERVLAEACAALKRWRARWPARAALGMSVNLSARQFAQPDLVERVRRIVAGSGIDPGMLKLEITETVMMGDIDRANRVLSELRALGLQISIDDFGTGYSCLGYLHRLPLQWLKIDRSFVSRMESNPESLQIVKTIMDLARNLNMRVIAEGVETAAEDARLRAMGCEYGQGYHYHRPMPEEAVLALLGMDG